MVRVGVGHMLSAGLLSQGDRRSDARCAWRGTPPSACAGSNIQGDKGGEDNTARFEKGVIGCACFQISVVRLV